MPVWPDLASPMLAQLPLMLMSWPMGLVGGCGFPIARADARVGSMRSRSAGPVSPAQGPRFHSTFWCISFFADKCRPSVKGWNPNILVTCPACPGAGFVNFMLGQWPRKWARSMYDPPAAAKGGGARRRAGAAKTGCEMRGAPVTAIRPRRFRSMGLKRCLPNIASPLQCRRINAS